MSVEAGDVSRAHFNVLQQWNDFSVHQIFDTVAMSDVAVGPVPSQEYVSTTVMPKVIQIAIGRLTATCPQHVMRLPHQDPRQYGVPDVAGDTNLAENSQMWRECMMYIQKHIVLLSSMVQELQTMRAAMNSWFPSTQAEVDLI